MRQIPDELFSRMADELSPEDRDEMAIPSYLHPNPASRKISLGVVLMSWLTALAENIVPLRGTRLSPRSAFRGCVGFLSQSNPVYPKHKRLFKDDQKSGVPH